MSGGDPDAEGGGRRAAARSGAGRSRPETSPDREDYATPRARSAPRAYRRASGAAPHGPRTCSVGGTAVPAPTSSRAPRPTAGPGMARRACSPRTRYLFRGRDRFPFLPRLTPGQPRLCPFRSSASPLEFLGRSWLHQSDPWVRQRLPSGANPPAPLRRRCGAGGGMSRGPAAAAAAAAAARSIVPPPPRAAAAGPPSGRVRAAAGHTARSRWARRTLLRKRTARGRRCGWRVRAPAAHAFRARSCSEGM